MYVFSVKIFDRVSKINFYRQSLAKIIFFSTFCVIGAKLFVPKMRPNCANICNLAYTDNLYENLQTRQKYLNAKYNSLEIFLARNSTYTQGKTE